MLMLGTLFTEKIIEVPKSVKCQVSSVQNRSSVCVTWSRVTTGVLVSRSYHNSCDRYIEEPNPCTLTSL